MPAPSIQSPWPQLRSRRLPFAAAKIPGGAIVPFLVGVGTFMNVKLVGYITLTEVFILLWFGYLFLSNGLKFRTPAIRWLLAFGLIWIFSSVATDFYRGSEFQQFARGLGRTVVMFCALATGYLYFRQYPHALKPLFIGFVVSAIVNIFGFRAGSEEFVMIHGFELESSWERNYTYVTLMLCFCAAAYFYQRAPWWTLALTVLIGALNIVMGSRNLGGTIIAAGLIAGLARLFFRPVTARGAGNGTSVIVMSLLITLVGTSVYLSYKYAAAGGLLGEKSQEKYLAQSNSPMGMIFGSRANFIGGLLAVKDSPIIGYGSWPADTHGYLVEAFTLAGVEQTYIKEMESSESFVRIPSHSMILEAWVEHGIFAMGFWIVVVVILFRALIAGALQDREWGLVNGLVFVWMVWNILFSPLGNRPYTAVMILVLVLASEYRLMNSATVRPARPLATRRFARTVVQGWRQSYRTLLGE